MFWKNNKRSKTEKTSILETAIKYYKANQDDDMAMYQVFVALAEEKIYLPYNDDGNLVSVSFGTYDVLPIFSRKENLGENEPVHLWGCHMIDCLDRLIAAEKNMIINPFSDGEIQLFLPYECIEKMLIPVMEQRSREW